MLSRFTQIFSSPFNGSMKIGTKTFGLVGFLLLMLGITSGVSIYQMHKIGLEIENIAERDLPLTKGLIKITVQQLEQAKYLERSFRNAQVLGKHEAANAEFEKSVGEFNRLDEAVEKEFKQAEALAKNAADTASTEIERKKFQEIDNLLKKLDKEHSEFSRLATNSFRLITEGRLDQAFLALPEIEAIEDNLDLQLVKLLTKVESFTAQAALTAEKDEKFAIQLMAILSALALIAGTTIAYLMVTKSITRPLREIVTGLDALNSNDMSVEVKIYHNDEIGNVARAYVTFRENMIRTKMLEEENETRKKLDAGRQAVMTEATENFVADIGEIVATVSSASTELSTTAQTMTQIAEETTNKSATVSTAATQASSNVQTVAAATQEMTASISNINVQVNSASEIAKQAVVDVADTNELMSSLSQTAHNIGDVVSLISDIAEQTNLLALNATIESARAGDAGKGFAVVASEVKSLANETAKATEGISKLIQEVQSKTESAVVSIAGIGKIIQQIDSFSSEIASAMNEQGVATQEIARSIEETASGTDLVSSNIVSVTEASQEAAAASDQVSTAAEQLSKNSEILKMSVDSFVDQIRVA